MNKVKIGIMTYHAVQNFGAALQAFALQQSIKRMGAAPELIRFFDKHNEGRPSGKRHSAFHILKDSYFRNELLFHFRRFMRVRRNTISNSVAFSSFKNVFLNISREPYYDLDDLTKANTLYNGFIVGSDMVWTPIGQNLDAYFLQFAEKGKRYSYAASMTGCNGYNNEEVDKIKAYIPSFDMISCREAEGVEYAKQFTSQHVELVCDPTLLLDKIDWKEELNLKEYIGTKPYILCYMFGGVPKAVKTQLRRISQERNFDIRYVPSLPYEFDAELKLGNNGPCGPREFAELFLNASFVVTNSYHGFLFSLINEKPFLVYHRESKNKWKANESRISDLLSYIGQEERYVDIYKVIKNEDFTLDYSTITPRLKHFRESSLSYLRSVVNNIAEQQLMEKHYDFHHIGNLSYKECTGCGVCEQICPFQAISMTEGDEGFLYPNVNENVCKKCNKCVLHCPSINQLPKRMPKESILAVSKDKIREHSASGGAFVTIAKYFIEDLHGAVYGCVLDSDMFCHHAEATTMDELHPMQNSKYIQSVVGECYRKAKAKLDEGCDVLFTGTPCQIAGLRTYLGKDYDNLLTVEIICHGVPNQKYWKQYIENLRKTGEVKSYLFRNRTNRATGEATLEATLEVNGTIKHVYCMKDPYYGPFVKCESYRPSCYYCQYARKERQADITIGDCDSHRHYLDFYPLEEKSSILLNTEKAVGLWEIIKDRFERTKLDYTLEYSVNTPLSTPSPMPERRDEIYKDLYSIIWKQFEKKYAEHDKLLNRVFRIPFRLVKRLIH